MQEQSMRDASDGTNSEVVRGEYTSSEGTRPWRLFVPSRATNAMPSMLLVMLHGCTQSANDFAAGSRMDVVAEEQGYFVLYPEQLAKANARSCWNWFDAAHQMHGHGEPSLIAGMVNEIARKYAIDAARVHLVGVSAGAAMATLTAVAYPQQFATLTSASGIGWRAATDVVRALTVMQKGGGDGLPTSQMMIAAMGSTARAVPTLVLHGGRDAVVNAKNADDLATQWVGVHDALRARNGEPALLADAAAATRSDNGYTVNERSWRDSKGSARVTLIRIEDLGHAWSGGSTVGTFTDAKGPDASRLIAAFCAAHARTASR